MRGARFVVGLGVVAGLLAPTPAAAVCESDEPEYYWDGPYLYGFDLVRAGDRTLVFWSDDDGIHRVTVGPTGPSAEVSLDRPYLRFAVASSGDAHLMVYATTQLSDARHRMFGRRAA